MMVGIVAGSSRCPLAEHLVDDHAAGICLPQGGFGAARSPGARREDRQEDEKPGPERQRHETERSQQHCGCRAPGAGGEGNVADGAEAWPAARRSCFSKLSYPLLWACSSSAGFFACVRFPCKPTWPLVGPCRGAGYFVRASALARRERSPFQMPMMLMTVQTLSMNAAARLNS